MLFHPSNSSPDNFTAAAARSTRDVFRQKTSNEQRATSKRRTEKTEKKAKQIRAKTTHESKEIFLELYLPSLFLFSFHSFTSFFAPLARLLALPARC